HCIIAGGADSMSAVPMTGFKPELNYDLVKSGHEEYYWGMGNTAEAVAKEFNVSREDQDEFAYNSHRKALKALAENRFKEQIVPIEVQQTYVDENEIGRASCRERVEISGVGVTLERKECTSAE